MRNDTQSTKRRGKSNNRGTGRNNRQSANQQDEGFDLAEGVQGLIGSAREGIAGLELGRVVNKGNLPVALASFAIGAAVGVIGALAYPMVRDSQITHELGHKLSTVSGQVKDKVSEGVSQAKSAFNQAVGKSETLGTTTGESSRIS